MPGVTAFLLINSPLVDRICHNSLRINTIISSAFSRNNVDMVGASQFSLHCNIIYSFHSFDFYWIHASAIFHGTTDIKSWLVAVEDPTVQVVQLREFLKSGRIGFVLHCDIVSVVVMMIEFWQLGSVEGNILWMTI
jgi:hypothetical protein